LEEPLGLRGGWNAAGGIVIAAATEFGSRDARRGRHAVGRQLPGAGLVDDAARCAGRDELTGGPPAAAGARGSLRRGGVLTAPIAWTASGKPARAPARM